MACAMAADLHRRLRLQRCVLACKSHAMNDNCFQTSRTCMHWVLNAQNPVAWPSLKRHPTLEKFLIAL